MKVYVGSIRRREPPRQGSRKGEAFFGLGFGRIKEDEENVRKSVGLERLRCEVFLIKPRTHLADSYSLRYVLSELRVKSFSR